LLGVTIATKKGDTGTTGLLYGGRVKKNSARIECNGAVDEAQAAIGYARALVRGPVPARGPGDLSPRVLNDILVAIERDLWVLMAEVATSPANRRKLVPGVSLVTADMVDALTDRVNELETLGVMPKEFVVPGENLAGAALDVARTIVRRAERHAVGAGIAAPSAVVPYLNRLSDVCWLLARAIETEHLTARAVRPQNRTTGTATSSRASRRS